MNACRVAISILWLVLGTDYIREMTLLPEATTVTQASSEPERISDQSVYLKYRSNIEELNQQKSNSSVLSSDKWEDIDSEYWEIISPGYATQEFGIASIGEEYPEGMLTAKKDEQQVTEMRIAILDRQGWMEYTYYRWDDIVYVSCKGEGRGEKAPEYQTSEYCLDYYGTWEDAAESWERELYFAALEDREGIPQKEYYIIEENIYEWDDETKSLTGIVDGSVQDMVTWIFWEAERVFRWMRVTPETEEKVQGLLPDAYLLLDTVVCDFNEDCKDDYVVMVYQKDEQVGDVIWRDAQMWLLLSTEEGNHEKTVLLDQKAGYCSIDLFPGGQLRIQNDWDKVSDNSLIMKTEYFCFDQGEKEFYLHKALQSDMRTFFRIKGEDEIRCTIKEYYANRRDWISTGVYYGVTGRIEGNLTLFLEDFSQKEGNRRHKKAEEALYRRLEEIQKQYGSPPHIRISYENEIMICGTISCDEYEEEFCIER